MTELGHHFGEARFYGQDGAALGGRSTGLHGQDQTTLGVDRRDSMAELQQGSTHERTEQGPPFPPRSGKAPGVGLLHAPFSLLPMSFPRFYWDQALELAPLFNELVDRVCLDGEFLQQSLARTKQVDLFTKKLLDIHSEMMELSKKEEIGLGLTRSDYMVDGAADMLLQVELNTISTSSNGLACGVSELHRNLIRMHEREFGLDQTSIVGNTAITQHAESLAGAWAEYNNPSAVVLVVVQQEERNGWPVALVYFRAGYSPNDYPSEAEWRARSLIERSSAIKCPSISYHLVGTKKIQQELAKENVLERFLDNKGDIERVRQCFAGLWSYENDSIVMSAIETPELFVLKPQREGGGNNIYGDNLRETLVRLRNDGGNEIAAYILMQRIFPPASLCYLVREGTWAKENAVSEFRIFGAYLR
ncbi:Glutathione synthetase, chloroplastic [Panicum miliaceum]|uniref:Glutathione synthetase n=1 Tax=Panicum miliaceum TaxID=4540 RepID=A0A3L6RAC7_PANMI|nr:Glutathione synthetase, chloroplastic [Panicum miliaceum]